MSDHLLPIPLTERSVHLCVDMQRLFSADGPWPTPWMDKVLPVVVALASRHPERTIFTRFIRPSVQSKCQACGDAITRAGAWRPGRSFLWSFWS